MIFHAQPMLYSKTIKNKNIYSLENKANDFVVEPASLSQGIDIRFF